jgi:superfamily II DNA or RNA helicase
MIENFSWPEKFLSLQFESREILLIGDMGKKARKEAFDQIDDCVRKHTPFYILSTGSLIGESVDIPMLDRLILAMSISFKGRLKQYVARIQRPYEGKKSLSMTTLIREWASQFRCSKKG